jgi:DNA polymerase-3 subunit epsilon
MFNWFKKKEKIENPIEISVSGINPQTENEFLFYNFVESEYAPHLEKWYQQAKSNGIVFKPQFEQAIKQKVNTGKFENPHKFPSYFKNGFDFIGLQFLSGTDDILSAFELGAYFIIDEKIVHKEKFLFRPNSQILNQPEFKETLEMFEIDEEFVKDFSFEDVWEALDLKLSFNHNLVVCWNKEIEILEEILKANRITDYNINYIQIREIAKDNNLPDLFDNLLKHFNSDLNIDSDLSLIAPTLALEFKDIDIDLSKYVRNLNPNERDNYSELKPKAEKKHKSKTTTLDIQNENLSHLRNYSIDPKEINKIDIKDKGFIFTGEITTDRDIAKNIITSNGGIIKPSVTSKVDFVIIGADYGWAKIQKVHELNSNKGCNIKILINSDFEKLCEKYAT